MSKKLVALAVAGACAVPLAGQAQTANVTLYGRINMTMEMVSGEQADGSNPNVFRVSSNASRLGVRGSESLGGGVKAIFQIESSINADSGGGQLTGRDTFVGLQGSWGTFKMGRFTTPYNDLLVIFGNAPTLTTSILSSAAIWAQGPQDKTTGDFTDRLSNSVSYESPSMSGLRGKVQYASMEGSPSNNSGVVSTGLFYNNGPIQAGLAYERNNDVRGVGLDDYALSIAAGYNLGFIRPSAVYERLKYETPTGDLKRAFWGVGLTVPVGIGTVYAFWGKAGDGTGSAADGTRVGGLAKGGSTGSDQWEIDYTYPLSKQTLLYAGYVAIDNDENASYTVNINPYPVKIGGRPKGCVLGIVRYF